MTAPDTNTEKQKRRHRPALIGIAVSIAVAGLIFLFIIGASMDANDDSIVDEAADAVVDPGAAE